MCRPRRTPCAEREWLSWTKAHRRADRGIELALVEALEEEAARVGEHLGLDDQHPGQRGRRHFHQNTLLSAIWSRYLP
jgi:hypothetical protein